MKFMDVRSQYPLGALQANSIYGKATNVTVNKPPVDETKVLVISFTNLIELRAPINMPAVNPYLDVSRIASRLMNEYASVAGMVPESFSMRIED